METTEIIAELRKAVAVGDSPVFCGGSFIPKRVAMEAADALERQQHRLRELSETALRLGDEIAKQHERMRGDLISRADALNALKGVIARTGLYGVSIEVVLANVPAVEAEPVVHAHWMENPDPQGWFNAIVYCSACKCGDSTVRSPRCRYCGAHMDEEVECE